MNCTVTDLRSKQVISVKDGSRIGTVYDVLVDTKTGCVVALLVFTGKGFMGFCGKGEEIKIPWCDVEVIGAETILVKK